MERHTVAEILGLTIDAFDPSYVVQQVSTGIPFFIVPLRSLQAHRMVAIALDAYKEFQRVRKEKADLIAPAFLTFSPETVLTENDLHCRMHCVENGIAVEDAATGSANGCLLAYLLKHHYFKKDVLELRVEQGFEMNRPSIILHKGRLQPSSAQGSSETFSISIGGSVALVAKGQWFHLQEVDCKSQTLKKAKPADQGN